MEYLHDPVGEAAEQIARYVARARMLEYAQGRGIRGFRADVLVGNTRMMRVFQRAGHQLSVKTSAGISEVTMLFS